MVFGWPTSQVYDFCWVRLYNDSKVYFYLIFVIVNNASVILVPDDDFKLRKSLRK